MEWVDLDYKFKLVVKDILCCCNIDKKGKLLHDVIIDKQIEVLKLLVSIAACTILDKLGKALPKKEHGRLLRRTNKLSSEENTCILNKLRIEYKDCYEGIDGLLKKLIDRVDIKQKAFDGYEYLYPAYVLYLLNHAYLIYEETPLLLDEYLQIYSYLPGYRLFEKDLEIDMNHSVFAVRYTISVWGNLLNSLYDNTTFCSDLLKCDYSEIEKMRYLIQTKVRNLLFSRSSV